MLRRPPTTLTLTAEDIAAYEDRRFAQQQAQLQAQAQAQARAQAQAHAHAQLQARSQPPRGPLRHHALPQPSAMDTSTSSPNDSIDEAMEDAAAAAAAGLNDDEDDDENEEEEEDDDEDEEEDEDDDDPFAAQRHIRSAAGTGRAVSPGAQRSAYIRQMRTRGGHVRSHSHTHAHSATSIPTATSSHTSTAASRAQRIANSASASALPPPAQNSQAPTHLQQTPLQNAAQGGAVTTRAAAGRGGGGGRQTSEPPPAPTRVTRSRDERLGIAPGQRPLDGPGGAAGPTTRRR
ncbi:hypothetical protein F5B21DRAFT_345922 [Xylaria acuta]|nr:hypothetical protein F5B21DRAFT_345922 [Xylaria acuta]